MPCGPPARRLMAMNNSAHAAAGGLYSFKSWYARRLAPVRRRLVAANVPPAAITITGIFFGGGAGAVLALLPPGPATGAAVAALLAARLACANLDGGVARDGGRSTSFGSVLNEVGDRAVGWPRWPAASRSRRLRWSRRRPWRPRSRRGWRWPARRPALAGSRAARSGRPNA